MHYFDLKLLTSSFKKILTWDSAALLHAEGSRLQRKKIHSNSSKQSERHLFSKWITGYFWVVHFKKEKFVFNACFILWCFELYKQWHESSRNSLLFHNVMRLSSWRLSFFRQACLEIPSPSKWRDVQINQTWFVLLSQGNVFTQVLNLPRVRGKKNILDLILNTGKDFPLRFSCSSCKK